MDKLDKKIQDLFKDYHVDYDPHSWSAMEEKIDTQLDQTEQFDNNIQEKLRTYKEPYDHTTWPQMESRIQDHMAMQKKILTTKFLEVLVIVLLIFSVSHYSHAPILPKKKIHFAELNAQHPKVNETNPIRTLALTPIPAETTDILSQENFAGNQLIDVDPDSKDTNALKIIAQSSAHEVIEDLYLATKISGSEVNDGDGNFTNIDHDDAYAINQEIASDNLEKITSGLTDNKVISALHQDIPALTYKRTVDLDIPMDLLTPVPPKREKFVSLASSMDLNMVSRPFDFQLLQDPINYGAMGYSFGILYASKIGRHELETGILFSQHSTNPNQTEKISIENSYYDREFYLQKFDLFKIPLDAKYHIIDREESNFYVSIGIDLHIIGNATYKFSDRLKSGSPKPESKIKNRSTLEQRKNLKGGLFDGGSLENNSFVNVGAGIGYIKNFGTISLFTEASYKHHIFATKLGPNNENINTFSIKTGVRKRI